MNPKVKSPFKLLYFITFIFSIQYGLVVYINSSFLATVVGEKWVGGLFTIASLLSILVLLEMPRVLRRFGNYKTTIFFVLGNAIALSLLGILNSDIMIIVSFFLYNITNYCLVLNRDIFIEEYTLPNSVGKTRGVFLTIMNFALVLAIGAAFLIVSSVSYIGVYLSSAILTLWSLFFIFPYLKNFKDPTYVRISVRSTFRKILEEINLKKIYFIQFLLCFFYSWMIIYMPIYLFRNIGLTWEKIGVVLAIMLLPFVILDYPLGKLSDKIGEKKMLALGFFIISFSTIIIFFLKTQNLFFWALVLFITRIGAATIEVMGESYFFKKINASDAGLISFFRNIFPFAFIAGPLLATPILFFIPSLEYIFLILGIIMIGGFFISLRLKDIK